MVGTQRRLIIFLILAFSNTLWGNTQCRAQWKSAGEISLNAISQQLETGQTQLRVEDAIEIIKHKLPVDERIQFQELLDQNL